MIQLFVTAHGRLDNRIIVGARTRISAESRMCVQKCVKVCERV